MELMSELVKNATEINAQERRAVMIELRPCERIFHIPRRYELLRMTDPAADVQITPEARVALERHIVEKTRFSPAKMAVEMWAR